MLGNPSTHALWLFGILGDQRSAKSDLILDILVVVSSQSHASPFLIGPHMACNWLELQNDLGPLLKGTNSLRQVDGRVTVEGCNRNGAINRLNAFLSFHRRQVLTHDPFSQAFIFQDFRDLCLICRTLPFRRTSSRRRASHSWRASTFGFLQKKRKLFLLLLRQRSHLLNAILVSGHAVRQQWRHKRMLRGWMATENWKSFSRRGKCRNNASNSTTTDGRTFSYKSTSPLGWMAIGHTPLFQHENLCKCFTQKKKQDVPLFSLKHKSHISRPFSHKINLKTKSSVT